MKLSLGNGASSHCREGCRRWGFVSAMCSTTLFIISGILGFSQYPQMASLEQRDDFKLHDSL